MINPNNPVASIRNFTAMGFGSKDMVEGLLDKVNMIVDGGDLIQVLTSLVHHSLVVSNCIWQGRSSKLVCQTWSQAGSSS